MEDPATQVEAFPPAREPVRPLDDVVGSATDQPVPPVAAELDFGRDYPTPAPHRIFFVQARYRYLGAGEPLPLAPEALDDRT